MNRPNPRSRRTPTGLLGTLLLALVVECFLAANPLDFGMPDWGEWSFSATAARRRAPGCDVLCFGDSMVKCGIQPRVIERTLGRRAYNLAVSAASAPAAYYLFDRALRNGAQPSAVVVDFQPTLLTEGPQTVGLWGQLLALPEILEVAWICRDGDFFASSALRRYFPSIRGRAAIRLNILAAVFGIPTTRREDCLGRIRNWNQNLGGFVGPVNPAHRTPIGAADERHLAKRAWNDVNLAYVDRFLMLAESRAIPVFLVVPPLAPELELSRERLGLGAQFDRLVRGWQARFPLLSVLDARNSGYATAQFTDAVHLNRDGAVALSLGVAEAVKHDIDAQGSDSAWVTLPSFRYPSDGVVSIEDYLQSMAVVRAVSPVRR
jgi:hypothetical protein